MKNILLALISAGDRASLPNQKMHPNENGLLFQAIRKAAARRLHTFPQSIRFVNYPATSNGYIGFDVGDLALINRQ